jgi:hypothetical protein
MVWDFAEVSSFTNSTGSFDSSLDEIVKLVERWAGNSLNSGQTKLADACNSPLPNDSCIIWFTDPPYYDAVPYADLSDFFYVWLKRALPDNMLFRDPFDTQNLLTPKVYEIVQDEIKQFDGQPKDRSFFEKRMGKVFGEGRRILREDGIGSVVFAHKTTEGWEALLSGMLSAGWTITASWPIHTERPGRLRAQDSAALATSVHLVCRPRSEDAGTGDWSDVKSEMERRVRIWMGRLIDDGIRGADAIFSCIGPALEVYSRYESVETPAGKVVPLGGNPDAIEPQERGFLAYVFETVSHEALRQVLGDAETEGFEEDARLTALFLWTIQTTRTNGSQTADESESADEIEDEDDEKPTKAKSGLTMPFDTFIRITRPMGIHYLHWEDRIIEIEKGVVRLIPVPERKDTLLGEDFSPIPIEAGTESRQLTFFGTNESITTQQSSGRSKRLEDLTTLDRLHTAMLLFGSGQTSMLRQLLSQERQSGRRFERLALALTALYPANTQERRWLESVQGMIRQ